MFKKCIMAHDPTYNSIVLLRRTEYLGKTLESLAGLSGLDRMTVYVSQDGQDIAVSDLVQQYGQGLLSPPHTSFFDHWQRERVPQLGLDQARCIAAHTAHAVAMPVSYPIMLPQLLLVMPC